MKKVIVFLIFLTPSSLWAASCCGGGFSIPALILGDDKAQTTSSISSGKVTDDTLSNGKWMRRQDGNLAQTLKLEGAARFAEEWQGGLSLPFIAKTAQNSETTSGVGDVSAYLGHESFPEKGYSRWKPKGVSFIQVTLPTSPSVYDALSATSTEIRGRGFYSLGAGIALLKSWTVWDANFNTEVHHSLPRHLSSTVYGGDVEVRPGWGFSQTWGLGWNRGDFRLGCSLSFLHEDPIHIQGTTEATSSLQRNFTLGFAGSYMLTPESALTASYSDQTLFGTPINSSLSKTINLSYQHRWPL